MIRVFLHNRIWLIGFRVMSSIVQVIISQNELKLFGSVEKWITLIEVWLAKISFYKPYLYQRLSRKNLSGWAPFPLDPEGLNFSRT